MSDLLRPNRPDALGFWEDSGVDKQSKYVDAVQRLVIRLKAKTEGVRPQDIRGKRRLRKKPQDASNTIRMYLKALELFTYWMQAKYNRELDPDEVTRRIALEFYEWLRGVDPPDIRGMIVRASGMDSWMIYEAVEKASHNREVSIVEIYEMLTPSIRSKFVFAKKDGTPDFTELHKRLGLLIRQYRWIYRLPNSLTIRREQGRIWTKKERNPMIYRYMVPAKRQKVSPGTVATYLSGLSAMWSEMLKEDAGPHGQAPLRVNVWKEPARISLREAREDRKRSKRETMLTHQLSEAIFRAASGTNIESLRDTMALYLLTHACLRSEELAGALRKDLYEKDSVLTLSIRSGKGDKTREIPLSSEIRDAIVGLDHALQRRSQEQEVDEFGQLRPTFWARYCASLITNVSCPLLPALPRWGANEREGVQPEPASLEPLDTSGIRRILYALAERARVVDVSSGVARPLNADERARVHAHNFRHYGATCAREAGMPLDEIRALLGHESIKTTEGYVHIEPESVILIGAYIAKARRGLTMSTEEAQRMRSRRSSLLNDERIIASEPEQRKVAAPVIGTERPQPGPRKEPGPPKPIQSPDWAYQPMGDKLVLYLPEVHMSPRDVPKGEGAVLTYRIGVASRLPWWMGRKNIWKESEMAPILSHFQTQPETEPNWEVLRGLQAMYQKFWYDKGPTAARALVAWIGEIAAVASRQFSLIMRRRGDNWIDFRASAMPGELGVVREHQAGKILEWFETHASMATQPLVRRPYNWTRFDGVIKAGDYYSFYVPDTADNGRIFQPGREIKYEVVVSRKGEGTGTLQWRHGTVTSFQRGGQVVLKQQGPRITGKIQQLQWADVTTWGEMKESSYPALVAMQDLPKWFFDRDPLLTMPEDERAEMRKWIEQLQGIRTSVIRTTIIIDDLVRLMETWGMFYKAAKIDPTERQNSLKMMKIADDQFKVETSKPGRFGEGVTLPAISIYDIVGRVADASISKLQTEIKDKVREGADESEAVSDVLMEHPELEEPEEETIAVQEEEKPTRKSLKYGERLVLFLKGKHGIDISAPGAIKATPVLRTRLFDAGTLTFNQDNTIVHAPDVKTAFWRQHGTDSECVIRRIVRQLWERHKETMSEFGPEAREHHDMIRRHYYAMVAYAVPCPAAIEAELRKLHPIEMGRITAEAMSERIRDAWEQTMLLMRHDLGEMTEGEIKSYEESRHMQMSIGERAKALLELETEEIAQKTSAPTPHEESEDGTRRRRAKPNFSDKFPNFLPDPVLLAFAERWVT